MARNQRGRFEIIPNTFNGIESFSKATILIDSQMRKTNSLGWIFCGKEIEVYITKSRCKELIPPDHVEVLIVGERYRFTIPDKILQVPGKYMLNIKDRQDSCTRNLGSRTITIQSQIQCLSNIYNSRGLYQISSFYHCEEVKKDKRQDLDDAVTALYQDSQLPLVALVPMKCENPTLLHVACRYNLLKLATLLCDTVNITVDNKTFERICFMKDRDGKHCIQIAKTLGHDHICELIIEKQRCMDEYMCAARRCVTEEDIIQGDIYDVTYMGHVAAGAAASISTNQSLGYVANAGVQVAAKSGLMAAGSAELSTSSVYVTNADVHEAATSGAAVVEELWPEPPPFLSLATDTKQQGKTGEESDGSFSDTDLSEAGSEEPEVNDIYIEVLKSPDETIEESNSEHYDENDPEVQDELYQNIQDCLTPRLPARLLIDRSLAKSNSDLSGQAYRNGSNSGSPNEKDGFPSNRAATLPIRMPRMKLNQELAERLQLRRKQETDAE